MALKCRKKLRHKIQSITVDELVISQNIKCHNLHKIYVLHVECYQR
jgi:hypothetical protein